MLALQAWGATPIAIKINPAVFVNRTEARITTIIERDPTNWELTVVVDGEAYYTSSTIQLHDTGYRTQNILELKDVPCDSYEIVGVLVRRDGEKFTQSRAAATMVCASALEF